MANYRNTSRILAAAIVSANAMLLLAAPVHATVNTEVREPGQVINGNGAEYISSKEFVRVAANSGRRYGVQGAKRRLAPRRQTTTNPYGGGSLSNGGAQEPLQAGAGDEFKKFLKKMPKPHCGGKHSIC